MGVTDTERLDWMADERLIDGIGDFDISDAACSKVSLDATDEEWDIANREALREAIDEAMKEKAK